MDFNLNHEVNCSGMGVSDIKLNIFSWYQVTGVKVNNNSLDWQLTPNTPYSSWLWILGVDYSVGDFVPYTPVTVQVRGRAVWRGGRGSGAARAPRRTNATSHACPTHVPRRWRSSVPSAP